ncbi:MAG TPA: hopanoid biosynthesis-associated RND transporter HpnN, partial [Pseudolabrys sp.]|nr:hopanoid biosynthesis-associated RND transporter HpnN [Pseudolabrys sp.]
MLAKLVTVIVRICTRFPWLIIVLGLGAAAASAGYAAKHFAINTDYNKLISPTLDWRQRELEFERLFPGHFGSTLAVVDAPTAELAAKASAELTQKLAAQPDLFRSVDDMAGNAFFSRNGLLFRSTDEVTRMTQGLRRAGPLIGTLVADPSLRGLTRALSLAFIGLQSHSITLDDLARPLSMAAATVEDVLGGRPAAFSWQELLNGHPPEASDLRRLIEIHPVLDYAAVQPGKRSSDAIRQAAKDLDLAGKYHARVRLTGSVPMADEEFATVQQGALVNGLATVVTVLVILWLALKS